MPYLGNAPAEAYSQISYQDLTGGSGTSFTLDYPAGSAGEIEVFVNNVRQEPTVAYTVSGTSLTMTGSITATDDFYVVFQGKAQQTIGIPEKQTDGTYVFPDDVTVNGDLTVDTNTLFVDSTNNLVGIGTSSPNSSYKLDVNGAGYFNYTVVDNGGAYNSFSGASGISFSSLGLVPTDNTGSPTNGIHDLGRSTNRWKDLYLSGGAYLGGTGSANYLDDYEEGTFTPTANNGTLTVDRASYTKIGNLVFIQISNIVLSDYTSTSSLQIGGLPFASSAASGTSAIGTILAQNRDTNTAISTFISANVSYIRFYENSDTSGYTSLSNAALFSNSANSMYLAITYQTDS
jgi:hypothetical protein